MRYKIILSILIANLFIDVKAQASPPDQALQLMQLKKAVEELSSTVRAQQKRIDDLEAGNRRAVGNDSSPSSSAPVLAETVSSSSPSQIRPLGSYLPDIGVVADIVGSSTQSNEDEEGNDRLSLRELELVFGHDIDPYARMDAVITFSDQEDPDVEEANVTYWGLPFELKAKVGRMRQRIGKATAAHRDVLQTVDEPLVVQHYFGHEGLFRTGAEFSGFTPLSQDDFTQELILGAMEGGTNEGDLLADNSRHPSLYGHVANFYQLSDMSSAELGGTFLLGAEENNSNLDMGLFGIDATFITYVSPINRLKLQSEIYIQDRSPGVHVASDDFEMQSESHPLGLYALADYRISERWGAGLRYDFVEPSQYDSSWRDSEEGFSGYLTFFQSEFARWRLQYERVRLLEGDDDNRFFVQGTFAIGTHKHNLL